MCNLFVSEWMLDVDALTQEEAEEAMKELVRGSA